MKASRSKISQLHLRTKFKESNDKVKATIKRIQPFPAKFQKRMRTLGVFLPSLLTGVLGHGYLSEPPARNAMWRWERSVILIKDNGEIKTVIKRNQR